MSGVVHPDSGKIFAMRQLGASTGWNRWTNKTPKIATETHHNLLAHRDKASGGVTQPDLDPV